MSENDDYEQRLRARAGPLSRRHRVAFAGACCERARAVYEVGATGDRDWYFDQMYVVWLFALGKPVGEQAVIDARATAQKYYDALAEAEDVGLEATAIRCLLAALDSLGDESLDAVENAGMFAIDTAAATSFDDEHCAQAEREEEAFQWSVLDILTGLNQAEPVPLRAFEAIGWKAGEGWPLPSWFGRWENDEDW